MCEVVKLCHFVMCCVSPIPIDSASIWNWNLKCGNQTQVKAQTRPSNAHLGWAQANNQNHFRHIDTFAYLICRAYNTLVYKWLTALAAM